MAKQTEETGASVSTTAPATTPDTIGDDAQQRKGRPTPSRKEQEEARRQPIVVADRKEAKRRSRDAEREARSRAQAGYAAGEEKFLPVRDRGPQKRWVRDYVDARLSVGEFLLPFMFLVILMMYFPIGQVQWIVTIVLLGYILLTVADAWLIGYTAQKRINQKFGSKAEKVRLYAAMRSTQLRLMRMPKPQVKRFKFPD